MVRSAWGVVFNLEVFGGSEGPHPKPKSYCACLFNIWPDFILLIDHLSNHLPKSKIIIFNPSLEGNFLGRGDEEEEEESYHRCWLFPPLPVPVHLCSSSVGYLCAKYGSLSTELLNTFFPGPFNIDLLYIFYDFYFYYCPGNHGFPLRQKRWLGDVLHWLYSWDSYELG